MARSTYPRSSERHETVAGAILRRHAEVSGLPIVLPVPIEMIIEKTYRIDVVYERIEESEDTMILGALAPAQRRIIINTTHQDLLDNVIGPERFTLAHELGHWVYDADNPDQTSLDLGETGSQTFCYHRGTPGLSESDRLREVNANKLAAALLLPENLVRDADLGFTESEPRAIARTWGVSHQTLSIRLEELGLL